MTEYGKTLHASRTPIPGLMIWDLSVHGDNRGWFKENWQRAKMVAAGLPDFNPVQQNISFSDVAGTIRGIHAEPWDKYISVGSGRVFGAWVDMREGPTFGTVHTAEIDPSRAVFVPRGVGNGFQTLEPGTIYSYLVNDHFRAEVTYPSLHPGDATVAINWPIPLEQAELSAKDRAQGPLSDVTPIPRRKTLVLGSDGQLGRALQTVYGGLTHVEFAGRADLDLEFGSLASARPWMDYDTIINAAAFTGVDAAETPAGRAAAWAVNVTGAANLVKVAAAQNLTLVHVSSDYVFDGTSTRPYCEDDPVTPLGVYGQTKAAGDQVVATLPRHYIVRTSWVIGEGRNFVRTMLSLAERGADPSVVNDQFGRLTFASELARAIRYLLDVCAPYGTYNVSGSGPVGSWADAARRTFEYAGHDPSRVRGVSTAEYFRAATHPVAPRPANSSLDLTRIESTGFQPADAEAMLADYVRRESRGPGEFGAASG